MKDKTAERLLYKIMGWSNPRETKMEYADLHALAISGYDCYGQFEPSMRFVESLALWLKQFPNKNRAAAYEFVKKRLLFVTEAQMKQIISIAYTDYVMPILIEQVINESAGRISSWEIAKAYYSDEFKILHNQCLFAGMSDGAHTDDFRRSDEKIDHEQVSRTHEINKMRVKKLKQELKKRLESFTQKPKQHFRNVFLIDDFSASGRSYLREDTNKPSGVVGKISSFYNSIRAVNEPVSGLVDCKDLNVYVILYIATENAVKTLNAIGKRKFAPIPFKVIPIHILPESIKYNESNEKKFFELVKKKKFGWENIVDNHMAQGNTEKPYLGFNQCALPLILYHNTPNNSLPILHRNDNRTEFKGLFPRVSRHQ